MATDKNEEDTKRPPVPRWIIEVSRLMGILAAFSFVCGLLGVSILAVKFVMWTLVWQP